MLPFMKFPALTLLVLHTPMNFLGGEGEGGTLGVEGKGVDNRDEG